MYPNIASGRWENVLKDDNGITLTTLLSINESYDEFTGTMTAKAEGKNADSFKIPVKDISFSGYISNKILVITKLDKASSKFFRVSTLTVSEDGKTITLAPSGLVFNKK